MKRILMMMVAAMVALSASVAYGQYWGSLDISIDAGGTDCNIPATASTFNSLYVWARPNPAATPVGFYAVEFSADLTALLASSAGFIAGEVSQGIVTTGNISPGPGVQVGFATCQSSDIMIYQINVFQTLAFGGTVYIPITNSTLMTDTLAMADCTLLRNKQQIQGGEAIANGSCNIAVETTTWGRLKALYREEED